MRVAPWLRTRVARTSSSDAASTARTTRCSSASGPPSTTKPESTRPSMNSACASQPDCSSSGRDASHSGPERRTTTRTSPRSHRTARNEWRYSHGGAPLLRRRRARRRHGRLRRRGPPRGGEPGGRCRPRGGAGLRVTQLGALAGRPARGRRAGSPRTRGATTRAICIRCVARSSLPRARVIGGCSSHNGCIAAVGCVDDYDGWARIAEDETWSADALRPLFARALTRLRVRAYGRVEARAVERPDLVGGVCANAQPRERAGEQGPQGLGARGLVLRDARPAVVVVHAADRGDAAVVRRAPADHPRARQLDRAMQRMQIARVVAPRVRGDERPALEQVAGQRPDSRDP